MDQAGITKYILDTFPGVTADTSTSDTFFFYDPGKKFPFATIVTKDTDFDALSNLNRATVFRLNVGVGKDTYAKLFGASAEGGTVDGSHDFTALDRLLPHPVYGRMFWVCVLNPSDATFATVQPLLSEAYESSVNRYGKRAPPK